MPIQSLSQVRLGVNLPLTNVLLGYQHPERVGNLLFPVVPVTLSGGQVIQFGRESFRRYNARRVPGQSTKQIDFSYSGTSYSLVQDSLDSPLPREHMRDASVMPGIDLGKVRVQGLMDNITLSLEIDQATIAQDATRYATSNKVTITTKWTSSSADPIAIINAGREAVRAEIGMYPNVSIIGASAFQALKDHPVITDRFKYTQATAITADMIAKLLELDKLAVGKAIYTDDADATYDVWGDNMILAYVPPEAIPSAAIYAPGRVNNDMARPSYGYTYVMQGHPFAETPYWDNGKKSWVYGVTYERVPLLTSANAGYLISDII